MPSKPQGEAPTLLDAFACAPAAVLITAALGPADRKALRLAHPDLRAAVAELTTKLSAVRDEKPLARPPTALRWPAARSVTLGGSNWGPILAAAAAARWGDLQHLVIAARKGFSLPAARALAKA